ncbi:unnamed protein product [Ixodes pacificus]
MSLVLLFSTLFGLVCLASADLCGDVEKDPKRFELIFFCITSGASRQLREALVDVKRYTNCDSYVCTAKKFCRNGSYEEEFLKYLNDRTDIFCEFVRWTKLCNKNEYNQRIGSGNELLLE